MTPADMVLWTQRCLERFHGRLPAPFADPEAWHQHVCPACATQAEAAGQTLTTRCLLCGQSSCSRDWYPSVCILNGFRAFWDTSSYTAHVVACEGWQRTLVVYRLCAACIEQASADGQDAFDDVMDTAIDALFGPATGALN
jgi:hypothetical protein